MRFSVFSVLLRKWLVAVVTLITVVACSDIDCPLYNTVQARYNFYESQTKAQLSLRDTLTIRAKGTDSVLYNKAIGINTLGLPMSYTAEADTLLWHWASRGGATRVDTLIVAKTNQLYSASIDCSTVVFHHIKSVALHQASSASQGVATIDSIVIAQRQVNYEANAHLQVYISQ